MSLQGLRIALRSLDFSLREMRATEGDRVGLGFGGELGTRLGRPRFACRHKGSGLVRQYGQERVCPWDKVLRSQLAVAR